MCFAHLLLNRHRSFPDIADVSHFVEEGSILDVEASQRATTVYLIDRRLDMLPKALSADILFPPSFTTL